MPSRVPGKRTSTSPRLVQPLQNAYLRSPSRNIANQGLAGNIQKLLQARAYIVSGRKRMEEQPCCLVTMAMEDIFDHGIIWPCTPAVSRLRTNAEDVGHLLRIIGVLLDVADPQDAVQD